LERIVGRDWALADANRTIGPATTSLEYTMPVLGSCCQHDFVRGLKKTYNAGAEEHAGVGQLVDDIEKKGISLWRIVVRSSP